MCLTLKPLSAEAIPHCKPLSIAMRAGVPAFLLKLSAKYKDEILVLSSLPEDQCSISMNGQGYTYSDEHEVFPRVVADEVDGGTQQLRGQYKMAVDGRLNRIISVNGSGVVALVEKGETVVTHRAVRCGGHISNPPKPDEPVKAENYIYAFYSIEDVEAFEAAIAEAEEAAEPVES